MSAQTAIVKPDRFTYADYLTWPDDERWELIDGQAYAMCPAPTWHHQEVLMELSRQVANFLLGKRCRVLAAPFDVRLPKQNDTDDQTDTVVQPDLVVVCDPNKLDRAGCRGAPDWVVEVLSPSTAARDQITKRDLYQRHGVKEYWLVHAEDGVLMRYFLNDGIFQAPRIDVMQGSTEVAVLPGLKIDWELLRVPDTTQSSPRNFI